MFGVGDLFTILFGGAYAVGKGVENMADRISADNFTAWERQFVRRNTDKSLERQYEKMLYSESGSKEAWNMLKRFRRDNPIRCARNSGLDPYDKWKSIPAFGWKNIKYTPYSYDTVQRYFQYILYMLMQTHGKVTTLVAGRETYLQAVENDRRRFRYRL